MSNTNKFRNAYENLASGKTISGLINIFGVDGDYYIDIFLEILTSTIGSTAADWQELLTEMNEYLSVFEFDGNQEDQRAMMAAFGLILHDRMTYAASENIAYSDFFSLHFELEHCAQLLFHEENESIYRIRFAKMAAMRRLAKDPKQQDKVLVRECWDDWQRQSDRYKGKAEFSRDMLTKFESLQSQPVIERWCREWEKEAITQRAK